MRLLIVEDNRQLVSHLFAYFEERGYVLDAAPDGVVGKWLATTQTYDAIIVDWNLPRLNGRDLISSLRKESASTVPIIMLTARDDLSDKVTGFKSGADDYLTKPFEFLELEVRLEALMARRHRQTYQPVLEIADLRFDLNTMVVSRAGQEITLYPSHKTLLRTLMEASPAVVSHRQLEETMWGEAPPESDRLRAYLHELRRKVDAPFTEKLIHTLPRIGYRLAAA